MKSTKSLSEPQAVNNFCSRPWSELHIEEDGQVTPCCVMPSCSDQAAVAVCAEITILASRPSRLGILQLKWETVL